MTTGEKLKELRLEKGITQDELLKELNNMITKNTLSSAENDSSKKGPSFETTKLLAKYYDVDVEYLIDEEVNIRKKEYLGIYDKLGFSEKAIKKDLPGHFQKRQDRYLPRGPCRLYRLSEGEIFWRLHSLPDSW